jgi:hypothetical protein
VRIKPPLRRGPRGTLGAFVTAGMILILVLLAGAATSGPNPPVDTVPHLPALPMGEGSSGRGGLHTSLVSGQACEQLHTLLWYPADVNRTRVGGMLSSLCNQPGFASYVQSWGGPDEQNFSVAYGSVDPASSILFVYYALNWIDQCNGTLYSPPFTVCSYQADWTGNLSSDLVSGPSFTENHLSSSQGSLGPQGPTFPGSESTVLLVASIVGLVVLSLVIVVRSRTRNSATQINPPSPEEQGSVEGNLPHREPGPNGIDGEEKPSEVQKMDPLEDIF